MSKYNRKKEIEKVPTLQGGVGVQMSDEHALVGLLSTGLEGKFYEMEKTREDRLKDLIRKVAKKDKYLVAQMIVYTRTVFGQRSITHRAAVELAKYLPGEDWGKWFFSKWNKKENKGGVIFRLDDILEIAACYKHFNKDANLSNAIKKGFAMAIESADPYEIAKYQGKGKDVSLVDIVNLVHPNPSSKNAEALKQLIAGNLKQFNTAEDKNTKSGQEVAKKVKAGKITKEEAKVELKEKKSENWKALIGEGTIGYLSLLRNIKNIINTDASLVESMCELLVDKRKVKESLVFPHQIDLALCELESQGFDQQTINRIQSTLSTAYEISVENVKELGMDAHTAVVYDTSGSMQGKEGGYWGFPNASINGKESNYSPLNKASLIAATLAKGLGCDVYQFATTCEKVMYRAMDSVFSIKDKFRQMQGRVGHGTTFGSIFGKLDKPYNRIFIITDGQGNDSILKNSTFQSYKRQFGVNPYIYYVNLCGYDKLMFKENERFFHIPGYSASIYELASKYEVDPKALIKEIRKIRIKY